MNISVVSLSGEERSLCVPVGAIAADIKCSLELELRVPAEMQTLTMDGHVLDPAAPLRSDREDPVIHLVVDSRVLRPLPAADGAAWRSPPRGWVEFARSQQPRAWLRREGEDLACVVARSACPQSWPCPRGHPDEDRHFGLWINPRTIGTHFLVLDLGRPVRLRVVGAVFRSLRGGSASNMDCFEVRVSEEADPGADGGALVGRFDSEELLALCAESPQAIHEALLLVPASSARYRYVRYSFGTCAPAPALLPEGGAQRLRRADGDGTCAKVSQVLAWGEELPGLVVSQLAGVSRSDAPEDSNLQAEPAAESSDAQGSDLQEVVVARAPAELAEPGGDGFMSLDELRDKDLCKARSIDISARELHLSDVDFLLLFGMGKAEFAKLPTWKRQTKKKEHGLF